LQSAVAQFAPLFLGGGGALLIAHGSRIAAALSDLPHRNVRFTSAELLVVISVTFFELQQKGTLCFVCIGVRTHDVPASIDPKVSGDVTARGTHRRRREIHRRRELAVA
jgi:hypothetical protein